MARKYREVEKLREEAFRRKANGETNRQVEQLVNRQTGKNVNRKAILRIMRKPDLLSLVRRHRYTLFSLPFILESLQMLRLLFFEVGCPLTSSPSSAGYPQ